MNRRPSWQIYAPSHWSVGKRWGIAGFTLIEMLVVLAILGIIGAMGVTTYIRESQVAALRQAAIEMQSDLETLRSSTIRYNANSSFVLASDGKSYTLTIASNPTARIVTRTFQNGVVATRSGTDVTYTAPLSTTNNVGALMYTLAFNGNLYYVKVIGVTGKAVLSATP